MAAVGDRVGEYELEAELGEGGMATVYRARHTILDTHHAIKILSPRYRSDPETRKRFLAEAKIQAKHLDHPNIVKVTNIVATSEHAALVMELVDGPDLEALAGKLKDSAEIKAIFAGILAGVGSAHAKKIIHRDLKPANVLLHKRKDGGWTPKLTDFGVAKVINPLDGDKSGKRSTHADARMGTIHYMSPEQIRRAKDVTERSDIFSLGAMLYETVTGTVPFDGDNDYDIMEKIVNGRYVPPGDLAKRLDPVIDEVICKALSPDPAERYASCAEMTAALHEEPAAVTATAAVVAPTGPAAASGGRRSGGIVVLVAGIAAAGAAVFFITRDGKKPAPSAGVAIELAADAGAMSVSYYDEEPVTPGFRFRDGGIAILRRSPADAGVAISIVDGIGTIRSEEIIFKPTPSAPSRLDELSKGSSRLDELSKGSSSRLDDLKVKFPKPSQVEHLKLPPPPCQNGSYQSLSLNVRLAGTSGRCGNYAFVESTLAGDRACGGALSNCSLKKGKIGASFSCQYNMEPRQSLQGTLKMSCSGRRMSVSALGRTHKLTRH